MRISFFMLLFFFSFSLSLHAQLKYRAKEDFGLKGKVKSQKITSREIYNGDTTFGVFGGIEEQFFSEDGHLHKIIYTHCPFNKGETTFEYDDSFILVYSSVDTLSKDFYIIDTKGLIKFYSSIYISLQPNMYSYEKLIGFCRYQYTLYTYNTKGLLIEDITYQPVKEYTYDTTYFIAQNIYKYNRKGLLKEKRVVSNDTLGNSTTSYKYDRKRRCIKETYKFQDSATSPSNNTTTVTHQFVNNSIENSDEVLIFSTNKHTPPLKIKHYFFYDGRGNLIKRFQKRDNTTEMLVTYEIEYYN